MKLGRFLKLEVYGESHAPRIGMRLENFPAGVRVDFAALQAFMERRAPGRDAFSAGSRTSRSSSRGSSAARRPTDP